MCPFLTQKLQLAGVRDEMWGSMEPELKYSVWSMMAVSSVVVEEEEFALLLESTGTYVMGLSL